MKFNKRDGEACYDTLDENGQPPKDPFSSTDPKGY